MMSAACPVRAVPLAVMTGLVALGLGVAPVGTTPAAAQEAPGVDEQAADSATATVSGLLDRGRLQEAAWTLREAGDTARAAEILTRLESILRSAPRTAAPLGMDSQGVSYTWRLEHGQGVASIFKVDGSDIFCPECGADREVGTYRIDEVLDFDLTPMTVFTRFEKPDGDTLSGSTIYFMAGAESPADVGASKPDPLRLLDAITGNSDRHPDNWLIVDGRVVAIDHNRAFEYQPTTRPTTCWETEIDSIARPGDLGRPWQRYRALPADTFRAALAGVDTALVSRFLDMREEIIDRVEARIEAPDRALPHTDCAFPR